MGVRADPGSFRWCQALSRSRSFATTIGRSRSKSTIIGNSEPSSGEGRRPISCRSRRLAPATNSLPFPITTIFLTILLFLIVYTEADTSIGVHDHEPTHITAILGESVVFNCHVEFPGDHPVPYVLQWEKKVSETGQEIPIYIWYENYPTHSGEGYEGRVSRVSPDSQFGAASLNLTNIRESDQGWYECKVVFLNRSPNQHKNGTWFHLDVHAPPRFSVTPEDIIYVNLGDSIILNCQADGTPVPEILWYKDAAPVEPSSTVGIFNDGTELRISTIRNEDIGDYTCVARNGEGQVSHTARVIIAGGAVIMVPPTNQTKLEGEKVQFTCEAKAMPGNVTVRWYREGVPVHEVTSLETRVTIRKDNSLVINPVSADDSGLFLCEVSNGIGDPQSASAYLNVEYPAKVTFTPSVQYLPFRLAGVVQCYIKANPPLQYVTWTKDKRLLEPYQTKDIVVMNNGSLLFTRVNQNHQGRYTCTPYNAQGTQGSSGPMDVEVKKPPVFTIEPEPLYQRKVSESVEMHCDAVEGEGTGKPNIRWQRRDGVVIAKNRMKMTGGNITIDNLKRADFGYYQCVVSNEVATIVSATQLVIEGTQPHAPYNITGTATEFSVTLTWMPGYSGGPDYKQDYTLWYREAGVQEWQTIPVTPSGSTQVTINRLAPGTTYEFQVVGKNALGDGLMSNIVTLRTLEYTQSSSNNIDETTKKKSEPQVNPTNPPVNENEFVTASDDLGPKPGQPRNLTVTEIPNGFLISWQVPLERAHLIQFYTIKYRTDAQWKTLNRGQIRPEDTSYLVKNLVGGRTYYFRVLANSLKSYESSDEVKFPVPARVKHKAITAGVVGGILFFIVAIILSICAVKICNKRKRRKQEKAFNMVACRTTDRLNAGMSSGSISQVPLKRFKKGRVPGMKTLSAILNWIWPEGRCANCSSIYTISLSDIHHTVTIHEGGETIDVIDRGISVCGTISRHHHHHHNHEYLQQQQQEQQQPQQHHHHQQQQHHHQEHESITVFHQQRRDSIANQSQSSSSDDGGFLTRPSVSLRTPGAVSRISRHISGRTSWRRPLVDCPSQLSFRSDGSGQSYNYNRYGNILGRYFNGHRTANVIGVDEGDGVRVAPYNQNLHINTVSGGINSMNLTTPVASVSRISRVLASSPAGSSGANLTVNTPWSPLYFSDLSSVRQPSSAERSFPTPMSGLSMRYMQDRELPALKTIHEETRRMAQGFVPLHSPTNRYSYNLNQATPLGLYNHHQAMTSSNIRPIRSRLFPRQARFLRNTSQDLSPVSPSYLLQKASHTSSNRSMFGNEISPASRSSSSGFGSKNTSTQQNQSSQSGSTNPEWRTLPPYRPPPPPPTSTLHHQYNHYHPYSNIPFNSRYFDNQGGLNTISYPNWRMLKSRQTQLSPPTSNYTNMDHWLDLITRINDNAIPGASKAVDVGSVDGHYEFDPATPTPTASTPTGPPFMFGADWNLDLGGFQSTSLSSPSHSHSIGHTIPSHRKRISRYENIEARVQAMKEEFYAYRKRQAMKRAGVELESAC